MNAPLSKPTQFLTGVVVLSLGALAGIAKALDWNASLSKARHKRVPPRHPMYRSNDELDGQSGTAGTWK